jgi:biopolymer transport protein TolR
MSREKAKPEINVTPLVDVVLVLLIIFMVIAPQMVKGPRVEPPDAAHADAKKKVTRDPLTLKLTAEGGLFLEDRAIEDLRAELERLKSEEPGRRVVLRGDKAVRYGDVRRVFHEAQSAGFGGVALEVGERGMSGS